jgi:hypothetical protein
MEGLMMMRPGFEKKNFRIRDDLLNGNESAGVYTYIISGLLHWRRDFFRLRRKLLSDQLRRSLKNSW